VSGPAAALAARLRAELADLEITVRRAERLLAKARTDEDYLDGVSLNLHGFYSGAERIFEAIARELDSSTPSGPDWHRDLLAQMSAEVVGTRPAVIGPATRRCLDECRAFRHIVRNGYTYSLRSPRVRELGEGVRACYEALVRDLSALAGLLDSLGG